MQSPYITVFKASMMASQPTDPNLHPRNKTLWMAYEYEPLVSLKADY